MKKIKTPKLWKCVFVVKISWQSSSFLVCGKYKVKVLQPSFIVANGMFIIKLYNLMWFSDLKKCAKPVNVLLREIAFKTHNSVISNTLNI